MLSNKQIMASRLWFLVQIAASRFTINLLPRRIVRPLPKPTYSARRFLCADRKSDTFISTKLSSKVDSEVVGESKEVNDSSESSEVDNGKQVRTHGCSF